ncbi:MAG TPA: hypothetical protein VE175_09225 [Woeseiaceae bacterium]|jgi:hypothetical protein|nr:hypothetical protein [Woeseiaceae bacterium]
MKTILLAVLASALAGPAAGPAAAQDEDQERDMDATHCVRIHSIEDIDIVDADTLIFRMRGGAVYENDLSHRCVGLRRDDTLMYRSSQGQLCDVDIITVLEDWGFGFAPGASCGLGMFHPITAEIADELLRAPEQ